VFVRNKNSSTIFAEGSSTTTQYFKLKETFLERRHRLKKICRKYSQYPLTSSDHNSLINNNDIDEKLQFERFYEFKKQQFVMCVIPKVASTSLTTMFMNIAKYEYGSSRLSANNYHEAEKNIRNVTQDTLRQSYRTMVVRHPFERILSGYLWSIASDEENFHLCRKNTTMKVCRSLINDMLRVLNEPGEGPAGIISFAQFASFLINGTRSLSRVESSRAAIMAPHNMHWTTPYWKLCTPCHSDAIPTTIVKMDGGQFEQELDYVFKESGIAELMKRYKEKFQHINLTKKGPNRSQEYFSTLNKQQVTDLYYKYQYDFELFNYDIEPYLSYAK